MDHTIELDISTTATEKNPAKSELVNIGGYKWQLCFPMEGRADRFTIACNQSCDDRLWLCKVRIAWEEKEPNGQWKPSWKWEPVYWFNGRNSFSSKFKSMDPQESPKQQKPAAIKANIQILWAASEKNLPKIDAYLELGVGLFLPFPVNQHCLAAHSDFFRDLFFGEVPGKKGKKEAVQGGKKVRKVEPWQLDQEDIAEFQFMVYTLQLLGPLVNKQAEKTSLWSYRKRKEYEKGNIALLRLADKFQVPMLVDFAETMLIKTGPGNMELLKLADWMGLERLKQHCLDSITSVDYVKQLTKNSSIRIQLKSETRKQLDVKLETAASQID